MPNSASRSRLLSASGYGGDLTGLNNNSYLLALWCEMSLRCSLPFTFHFSSSLSVKLCWTHKLMNDKTFLGPTSFGSTQSPLASLWRGIALLWETSWQDRDVQCAEPKVDSPLPIKESQALLAGCARMCACICTVFTSKCCLCVTPRITSHPVLLQSPAHHSVKSCRSKL